jgi:hypothetical protein
MYRLEVDQRMGSGQLSIAFRPKSRLVEEAAKLTLGRSLIDILDVLHLDRPSSKPSASLIRSPKAYSNRVLTGTNRPGSAVRVQMINATSGSVVDGGTAGTTQFMVKRIPAAGVSSCTRAGTEFIGGGLKVAGRECGEKSSDSGLR